MTYALVHGFTQSERSWSAVPLDDAVALRIRDDLDFVLHLGDFVYEVVQYPEEVPGGHRYDRRLRDAIRFPDGESFAPR